MKILKKRNIDSDWEENVKIRFSFENLILEKTEIWPGEINN